MSRHRSRDGSWGGRSKGRPLQSSPQTSFAGDVATAESVPTDTGNSNRGAALCGSQFLFATAIESVTGSDHKGHSKKKVTDPYVYLINFRNQPTPKYYLSSLFFTVRFWAFLGEEKSKTRFKKNKNIPYSMSKLLLSQKSKKYSEEILRKSTQISMSFFLYFLCVVVFLGAS
jgi:hypothetical protein